MTPIVGDGATVYRWSDAQAFTVVKVGKNGKTAYLQRDRATLVNGVNSGEPDALVAHAGGFAAHVAGRQRWTYEADPEGLVVRVALRADGTWRTKGPHGEVVRFGVRAEHYDFNF
jgi:hypothetical protein